MLEIEGPAATSLEGVFGATWDAQGKDRAGFWGFHRPQLKGNVALAVVAARSQIHAAYLHAIKGAQRSVLIAAGYFVPDRALLAAIQGARERGVEVSIILPGKSDHWMIHAAGQASYKRLLSWGVRIYEWWDAMLHAKSAVVDSAWATVGSFNLDSLSRLHNHELNVMVADAGFAARLHDRFQVDALKSVAIVAESWAKRPWHRRLREAVAYAFRRFL
jgi:cardiolipin synthase